MKGPVCASRMVMIGSTEEPSAPKVKVVETGRPRNRPEASA
jgi:hypothetical protein